MIIQADSTSTFPLADKSVQCVVTSPPYWGLRDYGTGRQLGMEDTLQEYVENLIGVFEEVWRVMKSDGTLWLNLGDAYTSGGRRTRDMGGKNDAGRSTYRRSTPRGLKNKDLIGLPWRVAFALQDDGWYLRSDIIWSKPNAMPESVKDRPTRAHEYVFLLAKSERYFYDAKAVAEPAVSKNVRKFTDGGKDKQRGHRRPQGGFNGKYAEKIMRDGAPKTRNRRSVWSVATRPFPGAHFATFPEALVEPCVLAGSRPGDVVLDPFAGSGTVNAVSTRHGRRGIGLELNQEYCTMAESRGAR